MSAQKHTEMMIRLVQAVDRYPGHADLVKLGRLANKLYETAWIESEIDIGLLEASLSSVAHSGEAPEFIEHPTIERLENTPVGLAYRQAAASISRGLRASR